MTLPSVPVPAAMPSVDALVFEIVSHSSKPYGEKAASNAARAILALFAPILADKEQVVRDALREVAKWAAEAGEAQGRLKASEMAGIVEGWRDRALAAEAALAGERERAAKVAENVPAHQHGHLDDNPHYAAQQAAHEIAAAIRAQGE